MFTLLLVTPDMGAAPYGTSSHPFIQMMSINIDAGDFATGWWRIYRQIYNISRTLVGNNIVDHSDVVGVSPVGAAPTTSSFST